MIGVKNLVNFFGLSVYDKSAIPINTNVKILQVPGNIFNQEILTSQELNLYIERGGEVHVRSVFVQGLILMNIENIPINLHELIGPIKLFHNIAKEANVDPISLAIQSVYKLCPQCKLVLGANNNKQLSKTLLKSSNLINNSIVEEVLNMGRKFSNKLWDPRNWK